MQRDVTSSDRMPILTPVQTPEPLIEPPAHQPARRPTFARGGISLWGLGDRLTWVAGLVLAVSAFTGWYSGTGSDGLVVSVTAWNTGVVGKLVLLIGLAVLLLVGLREAGVELPAAVPESLVVIALGSIATILVLVRTISIPDDFFFAGRDVGLWISLVSALALIVAGLLQASEEL
jgi:hypothetical protein